MIAKEQANHLTDRDSWLIFNNGPYDGDACTVSFEPPKDLYIPESVTGVSLGDTNLFLLSLLRPKAGRWYDHYVLEDQGDQVYAYTYVEKESF